MEILLLKTNKIRVFYGFFEELLSGFVVFWQNLSTC
jgi:hypothetical protein